MAEFQYAPLSRNSQSIRLLELLPSESFMAPIRCRLRAARLGSTAQSLAPKYSAISYAWNDDANSNLPADRQKKLSIMCDDRLLQIPSSLFHALLRLRKLHHPQPLTLWADSVCINQADIEERNGQVSLMREIFSGSQEVIIWLGETMPPQDVMEIAQCSWYGDERDEGLDLAYGDAFSRKDDHFLSQVLGKNFSYGLPKNDLDTFLQPDGLPDIRAEYSGAGDYFGAFCLLSRLSRGVPASEVAFYQGSNLWTPEGSHWARRVQAALWAVTQQSWWKRTWVVQECVLAKSAILIYGNMSAPWRMVAQAAEMHMHSRERIDMSKSGTDPLRVLSSLIFQVNSPRMLLTRGIAITPLQLLQQFHARHATDPRGKVFGLLGLLEEPPVQPNYLMSPQDVFITTALSIIRTTRRLELLAGQRPSSQSAVTKLPTWCVDWGTPSNDNEWQRLKCLRLYNASGGHGGHVSLHRATGGLVLEVEGLVVDVVQETAALAAPEEGYARFKAISEQWNTQMDGEVCNGSFWRALCGDIFYKGEGEAGEGNFERATAYTHLQYFSWLSDDTAKQNRKSSVYGALRKTYVPPEHIIRQRNQFFLAMQTMMSQRRMFRTSDGRLGIGPATVRQGDVVAIIMGCSAPLLLTPTHCRFQGYPTEYRAPYCAGNQVEVLVASKGRVPAKPARCAEYHSCHVVLGDAYIDGLMDGQAMPPSLNAGGFHMPELYLV